MIVEALVLATIFGSVFGVGKVAKVAAVLAIHDRLRKTIKTSSPSGEVYSIVIDEFVDDDGVNQLEYFVIKHVDGNAYVLTAAELSLLRAAGDGDVAEMLLAVNRRAEEIKKSPTRRARKLK